MLQSQQVEAQRTGLVSFTPGHKIHTNNLPLKIIQRKQQQQQQQQMLLQHLEVILASIVANAS